MLYYIRMRYGKLSTDELKRYVLDKLRHTRKDVVLSAAEGEDCAALMPQEDIVLLSSDPITAEMSPESLGALSVHINCNDIAANGGQPIALMSTVIVPPDFPPEDIGRILDSMVATAATLNVDVIGGHTEFSDCVVRPITCTTVVGVTHKVIDKSRLQEGDKLAVTKVLGMEGMRIMLEMLGKTDMPNYAFYRDGLSVVPESRILVGFDEVGIMHDITEGGVLGAVAEVCGARLGATIDDAALPIDDCTHSLCAQYGVDPRRLLSSGSMLFSAHDMTRPIRALRDAGIQATVIGEVTAGNVHLAGSTQTIRVERDALYDFTEKRT